MLPRLKALFITLTVSHAISPLKETDVNLSIDNFRKLYASINL